MRRSRLLRRALPSGIRPHSTIVDDLIARVRTIEAENPQVAAFDESKLPPRNFEIGTPSETAWVNECVSMIRGHMRQELASIDERQVSGALHRALSPPLAKA